MNEFQIAMAALPLETRIQIVKDNLIFSKGKGIDDCTLRTVAEQAHKEFGLQGTPDTLWMMNVANEVQRQFALAHMRNLGVDIDGNWGEDSTADTPAETAAPETVRVENPKSSARAYPNNYTIRTMKVEFYLDQVPGTFHQPEDLAGIIANQSYVHAVEYQAG